MKLSRLFMMACLWLAWMFPFEAAGAGSRADFARALATLKPNTPAKQVLALLGKPDDIRTQYDPGGIYTTGTTEIWAYGTDGHLSFPTLGCVHMERGHSQYIFGGKGVPPDPAMLGEHVLKSLLRQIDRASTEDPLSLIQAVNRLQPLGKDTALAVASEYLRVADGFGDGEQTPVFLILRLLFEIPPDPGYMPPMLLGAPTPSAPENPRRVPLFPLVLLDDVPLYLLNGGYMLAGVPQPAEEHVDYFRAHGQLRAHPLRPTDDPFSVLAKLEHSPQWLYEGKPGSLEYNRGRDFLIGQLLRLVASVYRITPVQDDACCDGKRFDPPHWAEIVRQFAALHVKWNAARNQYVFADGTSLPEIKKPFYRRSIWELPMLGGESKLVVEREDRRHFTARLSSYVLEGRPRAGATLRLYDSGDHRQIGQIDVSPSRGTPSSSTEESKTLELPQGKSVQAELLFEGKTTKSPVFTP